MTNKKIEQIYENHRRKRTQVLVVMNENHSLLPEQKRILETEYDEYQILPVPADGWTLEEMNSKVEEISTMELHEGKYYLDIVFVSPIPYMIRELTRREVYFVNEYAEQTNRFVRIFHNDKREKKELPNGKIIQVVAKEGWQLV